MKNKYHTFFICMAFTSMALTGCDNEPPTISEQSKISIKESEKQNAIVADVSKNSPQLNTTFHFNGKSVTIPCRFSEFFFFFFQRAREMRHSQKIEQQDLPISTKQMNE